MKTQAGIYIGVMSGTSLDGIDVAVVQLGQELKLIGAKCYPIPNETKTAILGLTQPGDDEIERLGKLDIELARLFAAAINHTLHDLNLNRSEILAVGSHGQTIRHRPKTGFSLQAGDPNLIAAQTNIKVIADFRRKDLAYGGEGAPLVPAFHADQFKSYHTSRVILNIGGMSNITVLPTQGEVRGYDTGPGNVLLDAWCYRHRGVPYDQAGAWAASGICNASLLEKLMSLPFFHEAPPKSTGREQFNIEWLEHMLNQSADYQLSPADIQATLLELTARSISDAITSEKHNAPEIYICGGGAHNTALVQRLKQLLEPSSIATTESLGMHPDWVEAAAFAWLAYRALNGLSGNLPSVTGASKETILGGIYQAG